MPEVATAILLAALYGTWSEGKEARKHFARVVLPLHMRAAEKGRKL